MSANEISGYWYYDEFEYWISDATWKVDAEKNCAAYYGYGSARYNVMCYDEYGSLIRSATETVSSSVTVNPPAISGYTTISSSQYVSFDHNTGTCSPSTVSFYYRKNAPSSATLYIYCYDEYGSSLGTYTESINSSRTINPPSINGYTANSSGRSVTFNSSTGTCSPSDISFFYQKNSTSQISRPEPTSNPIPTSWDTKYKPGVSDKNPNGIDNLSRLTDGNSGTVFGYTLYNSDKKNGLPDFTANFNGSSVSGIKIRNGDGGDYYRYMRINTFYVKVYTNSGSYTESTMTVPDSPSSDYYSFSFRQRYSGVTRIEIYITDRHTGSGEDTNRVRIRDIAFY
jgi:hypothetical protein